jgi:two-component system sensor histidine kinase/response regulator
MTEPADILIVDDSIENLRVLGDMLRHHGHKARALPSGILALQACALRAPDLILLDINMPSMNGYEVCAKLKSDPALQNIPVIFISALDELEDKVKAFAVGGVDYITKPFQIEEVEVRVTTHLEICRQRREIQNNYDRIRKLEQTRKDMARLIVHDLRNPLSVINSFIDEIGELCPGMDVFAKQYLGYARSACMQLMTMTDSLLDLAKLEEGVMKLTREPVNVAELCREIIGDLAPIINKRAVTVQSGGEPPVAQADRELLRRIIQNILGNSLKFTNREAGVITLHVELTGKNVTVAIADNGPGIPAEHHQRIFEKFAQVDGTQIPGVHSTGLGLSLCKLGVEAHGGSIAVESAPSMGTTFRFTLPVNAPMSFTM